MTGSVQLPVAKQNDFVYNVAVKEYVKAPDGENRLVLFVFEPEVIIWQKLLALNF